MVEVDTWPMTERDGPLEVGDVVKLPWNGAVTMVTSISFGAASTGAYVNGFYIDKSERLELVRRERRACAARKEQP